MLFPLPRMVFLPFVLFISHIISHLLRERPSLTKESKWVLCSLPDPKPFPYSTFLQVITSPKITSEIFLNCQRVHVFDRERENRTWPHHNPFCISLFCQDLEQAHTYSLFFKPLGLRFKLWLDIWYLAPLMIRPALFMNSLMFIIQILKK